MIIHGSGRNTCRRASAPVIGIILMVGVFMAAMTMFHMQVVPILNHDAETNAHSQVLEDQRSIIDSTYQTSTDGHPRTTSIQMGVDYSHMQLTRPYPQPSSFETTGETTVMFENAEVVEGEMLDGKIGSSIGYTTTYLQFTPDYWEYRDAPTLGLENGIVYADHDNGVTLTHTEQTIVQDTTITLNLVEGDVQSHKQDSVSLTVVAEDTYETATVTDDGSAELKLTFETNITENEWREILHPEMSEQDGYVNTIQYREDRGDNGRSEMTLIFTQDVEYQVSISRVEVSSAR